MSEFTEKDTPSTGAGSYERLSIDSSTAVQLTIPPNASGALIQVTDSDATTPAKSLRFTMNTDAPVNTPGTENGFLLGLYDFLRLENKAQLQGFNALAAETGKTILVHVQYFING